MKNFDQWAEELAEHIAKKQSQGKVDCFVHSTDLLDLCYLQEAAKKRDGHTGRFTAGAYVYADFMAKKPLAKVLGYYSKNGSSYVLIHWSDDQRRLTSKGKRRAHGGYFESEFSLVPDDVKIEEKSP